MRDIAAVGVGVTRAWAERAGHGADRAADDRPRCGTAATAGNPTDRGAHSGAHQPAADSSMIATDPDASTDLISCSHVEKPVTGQTR